MARDKIKDKRKKGCPNEECINHIKKIRMKADEEVCPVCGHKTERL